MLPYWLSIITLSALYLLCSSSGGADWHAPNIVIQGGKWVQIPSDYYNKSSGKYKQPPSPYDTKYKKNDTKIIVLIASFRETRCKDTLYNLFTKASYPERIYIGIIQQNEPNNDEDCVYEYCKLMNKENNDDTEWNSNNCPYYDNIKIQRMLASEAKGPVYARAKQVELVDDEDYCMQIDAHSDVYPEWDVLILLEWGKCDNEYAVISTYPSNIRDIGRNSNQHWEMPHLCEASILGMGQVRNGRAKAAANLNRPILAPLWAAGLSFSRCHAELRVPNDINLKHVFNGEEFSRGSRLWTHGYDFYSPSRAYIGTYYQSEKGNKGSWHMDRNELTASNNRMGTLLKFPDSDQSANAINNLGKYGIGNQRTFEDYIEFSGVDTMKHNVNMNDKCIRYWIEFDHNEIKDEIIAINNNQNNENHQKMGIEIPHHNNIVIEDNNKDIHNEDVKIQNNIIVNPNDKDNNNNNNAILWIILICLCVVIIIFGFIYKKQIRKRCIDVKLIYKSEQHIV